MPKLTKAQAEALRKIEANRGLAISVSGGCHAGGLRVRTQTFYALSVRGLVQRAIPNDYALYHITPAGLAALRLGRNYLGIELNPQWAQESESALHALASQTDLLDLTRSRT